MTILRTTPPQGSALPAPIGAERSGAVLVLFICAWMVVMGFLGWLRYTRPAAEHGDPTTDANILNAGENFDREGLRGTLGIPALDTFRGAGKTPDYYTSYPPGAYWFHQAIKAMGLRSHGQWRLASLVVSGLAVWLLFWLVRAASGSTTAAALSGTFYVLSKPFLEYADNHHYIALSPFTLLATLLAWTQFERAVRNRARTPAVWLCACWLFSFVDSWLTFEHILAIGLFIGVRALASRRAPLIAAGFAMATAPVLALGSRLILNAQVLGGFGPAIAVLRGKLDQRVGSAAGHTGVIDLWNAWLPRFGAGWMRGLVVGKDWADAEFMLPILTPLVLAAVCTLAVIALTSWHLPEASRLRRAAGTSLLLAASGLTWFLAMTEHSIVHRFTAMDILPGVAALLGTLAAWGMAQRRIHPRGAPIRLVGPMISVFLLGAFGASLGSSFAVNSVVNVDSEVRAAIRRRTDSATAFVRASEAIKAKGVKRLFMFGYDAPAARALGVPFDNATGKVPERLGPGDALLTPLWDDSARAAAAKSFSRLGTPVRLGRGLPPYLLFSSVPSPRQQVDIHATCGLQLRELGWSTALDQSGPSLFAAVAAAPAGAGLTAEGLDHMGVTTFAAPLHATEVRDHEVTLWECCPEGDPAILARTASIRLRVEVARRPRLAGWRAEPSALPAGCSLTAASCTWRLVSADPEVEQPAEPSPPASPPAQ